jgi:gas vesicle protein
MPDHERKTIHGRTILVQTGFSGGQMMFAVLGGAVAGAVAGLLLAPRSGAETRAWWHNLADQAKEGMARLPDALREASAAAVEAFDDASANGSPAAPGERTRSTPPPRRGT